MAFELCLNHQGITTRLRAMADGVIRVTHTRRDAFLDATSALVVCGDTVAAAVRETEDAICFTAGAVTVSFSRETGALSFLNSEGRVLL